MAKYIPSIVVILHTLLIVMVGVIAMHEDEGAVLVHGVQCMDVPATVLVWVILHGLEPVAGDYMRGSLNREIAIVLSLHAVLGGAQYYFIALLIVTACTARRPIHETGFPVMEPEDESRPKRTPD